MDNKSLLFFIFTLLIIGCNSKTKNNSRYKLEMKAYNEAKSGNYRISLDYYNKLIKEDSLNGNYYFGRGDSYLMLLKKEEAIKDYLKSVQLNYRRGSCYYNLGLLYSSLKDSVALTYFKKALDVYPDRGIFKRSMMNA